MKIEILADFKETDLRLKMRCTNPSRHGIFVLHDFNGGENKELAAPAAEGGEEEKGSAKKRRQVLGGNRREKRDQREI